MRCGPKEKQMTPAKCRASTFRGPSGRLRQPRDAEQGLNLDGRGAAGVAVPAAHDLVDRRGGCVAAEPAARATTAEVPRKGRSRAGCGSSPNGTTSAAAAATIPTAIFPATKCAGAAEAGGVGRIYHPNQEDIGPVTEDGDRGRPRRGPGGTVRSRPVPGRCRQPAPSRSSSPPTPASTGERQSHPR